LRLVTVQELHQKMTDSKITYILYGSQTGNSEDIATGLSTVCTEELNIPNVQIGTLNSISKNLEDVKNNARLLLIVCSTTGNGDAPENADLFWRAIKLRSVAKNMLENVPYCVLGLGDTNYDKFCYMGKSIDKRLHELGGSRVMPVACADEATGLEEVVNPWLESATALVKKAHSSGEAGDQGEKSSS